ncbi:OmpA family protein [Cellulophaga baltica]|uniref:OmpA family protein n=1 Tax=Cellulophaga TaxID=104264 RepID=UPI001C073A43|nr:MULTISPECIES: OmpA family protein [Cellulophaga]MBU2997753.1 OmpA family protein [Cellulophaga baltica]MDO6769149.1 OmpA family protein [Cellulophaga sp. 1_MG-2023]
MKTKFIYLFFFFTVANISVHAQKVTKADKEFANYSYVDAAKFYKYLIDKGNKKESKYAKIADSYYNIGNYKEAASWYTKMMEASEANKNANYLYKYAQSLKSIENYKESDNIMNQLGSLFPNDKRYLAYRQNKDYLTKIQYNSNRYKIKNLAINTEYSEFATSKINDSSLVFSSNRDTGLLKKKIHLWKNQSFNKLFKAKINENDEITDIKVLNNSSIYNLTITTTAFSNDGTTVYFTKNNFSNRKFKRDTKNASNLKIYKADIVNGDWTNITDLPFNNDSYSNAHPTLSPDNSTLYFASDMPGSLGKSDIYKVSINDDGTFGTPENLGNKINTESRESFPYITENNILYYSSDGQPGLGGLDIFVAKLDSSEPIQNVGKPINSTDDDFSFSLNSATKKGFFTSKRQSGKGVDDIYSITELKSLKYLKQIEIEGSVASKINNEPIVNTTIMLIDKNEQLIAEALTQSNGTYNFKQELEEGNYFVVASTDDYKEETKNLKITDATKKEKINFLLDKIAEKIEVGTDLKKHLNLDFDNIHFEFDKSVLLEESKPILDKIIALMKENPNLKIEIRSHTDAIGKASYNKILSKRRAKSTLKYFVDKGIDPSKLTSVGMGESELINDCVYSIECSEDEHQVNRRSEFIVIGKQIK